jgi:hypothetical protein
LTATEYLCHKSTRIYSVGSHHNPVLSSFITYHWVCNKNTTTGVTSGTRVTQCLVTSGCVVVCRSLFVPHKKQTEVVVCRSLFVPHKKQTDENKSQPRKFKKWATLNLSRICSTRLPNEQHGFFLVYVPPGYKKSNMDSF